jgi:hypothetical protein
MRKVKVFARMCEEETGGFVTGIGTETKTYTEQEFRDKKHNELIDGIEMIEGSYWSWSLEWINKKTYKGFETLTESEIEKQRPAGYKYLI